jgi:hypothetical protein
LGNGTNSAVGVTLGGTSANVGVGTPGVPGTLGTAATATTPAMPGVVASMSSSQLTRMKKRCIDVLSSEGTYDSDLRQLCLMISRR